MIKTIPDQFWFPFWVDKWIFGSMRLEFNPEERSIWLDLLCLAAKDNGYIRANEETPYLIQQLAGLLVYSEESFAKAIEKFIEKEKLQRNEKDILYITNWEKYKLSNSYKRVLKHRKILPKNDDETESVSKETNSVAHIKSNHIKSNHIKSKEETILKEFKAFWEAYPKDKGDKGEALRAFTVLLKKESIETIRRAFNGYVDFLKDKRVNENFKQKPMYASTFLRKERWKRFLDFKYKPSL